MAYIYNWLNRGGGDHMAEDDKTRRPEYTKGGRSPEEDLSAPPDKEKNEAPDDEDGSLAKMEMEWQADENEKPAPPAKPPEKDDQPPAGRADTPVKPNDATVDRKDAEPGLKEDTATGALLLYAFYRAAKALGRTDKGSPETLAPARQNIAESVALYTGKQVKDINLMPEENGMRVAVDGSGRPVWATMKTSDQGERKLIFDWRQDGGLTINVLGQSGFEGRIASREKIEIAEGGKSLKSSDGTWLSTSADGSVDKWEGELTLKPGKSALSWTPAFGERESPLAASPEHKIQNAAADALVTSALDGMTQSKEAASSFTFRERALLKNLYQGLMKGSIEDTERALKDLCQSTQSPARQRQILNHFIDNAGLKGSLEVQQTERGTRLVFDDARGNLLGLSAVPDEASYAQRADDGKKIPVHDAFLELVRSERAARPLAAEKAQAAAEGKSHQYQKNELARATLSGLAASHEDLAPPQREILHDLERRFVSGDMDGFRQMIQTYDKRPLEVEPILKAFVADMKRFSKDFDGEFTAVKDVARPYGYFTFGDEKNRVGLTTEQGTPAHKLADGEPGLRRSAAKIGSELAFKVVKETAATQVEVLPETHQPMTGMTDSQGLWSPNYVDALPKDVLAALEQRIANEYALGGHEQMRDFAIRAGQTVSSWERTHQALLSRQAEEERARIDMESAKKGYLPVRDQVLKSMGLDKLPENMSLDQLQTSSTWLIKYLNSKEAKAADIAETRQKAKAVEEYQVARHNLGEAEQVLFQARLNLKEVGHDFLSETAAHKFPDGLKGKDIVATAAALKEYLAHPDAAGCGVKEREQKLQVIDAYLQAEANAKKLAAEKFEPAQKRYQEIRDEVLARLGADKIPEGMTSTDLKESAKMVRDLLKMQGKELGLKDLENQLALTDKYIERQTTYETARDKVNELFESRRKQFENLANEMAREMGLPEVKLAVVNWDKNAYGDYLDGQIRINRSHLLNSSETSVAGTVYHELIHAEQQYKMCRFLADQFAQKNGRQPDSQELRNAWGEHVGGAMSDAYSVAVLNARANRPLTLQESEMAAKLVDAWHKNGAVGSDYIKSMDAYHQLYRAGESIAGLHGAGSTEKLLDAFARGNKIKDISEILPGAQFQTGEGKTKSDHILRELVRDRVAYLNGETRVWDTEKARQLMFDAVMARRQAINEWREAEWASYGGPDKKHEYDAQVGGLFFERQAQEHKAKPPEFRAMEELLHGQKRNWLPENIIKHEERDATEFRFSHDAQFSSADANVKVKGVELKDGAVSILCEDRQGKVTSNRAMADLIVQTIQSRVGQNGDIQAIMANPQMKAELLARYLQDIKTSSVASFHQASQLGEKKSAIPQALQTENLGWKDIEQYMQERLPEGVTSPEDLIAKEIRSLENLQDAKLNRTLDTFKEKLREKLGQQSQELVRDLASGNIPLNKSVQEHLLQVQARLERQAQLFGKPQNYEETTAIFEALKLSGKQKEAAIKDGQSRFANHKEVWEKLLPQTNLEALELQRRYVVQGLKERGFSEARIDPSRKFNVFNLESVLRIASTANPEGKATPAAEGGVKPLPFTDPERTAITYPGQDIDLYAAGRAESAISRARDQLQRGLVKSHHELEALTASDYLNSALEAGRLTSIGDLLQGGRRAINPQAGNFYGVANSIAQDQSVYSQKIEQALAGKNSHTVKAVIDGKEVSLARFFLKSDQSGEQGLAFKGPQDIADKARVERRKEALFSEIQALSKQENDPGRLQQITRRVAELEWLSVQSADYWQKSSDLAQIRSRALFDAAGIETGRFKKGVNPAMAALTSSLPEFVAQYENLYEIPPRLSAGGSGPANEFARAFLDSRTTRDTGTLNEDGSLFFKLKEARKVKIDGVEHTILGVEARDGKTNVVTVDQFGRQGAEANLTQAYLARMEAALGARPIAQSAVMHDANCAANVLSRVIGSTSDQAMQETLMRFEMRKGAAREAFLQKHYYTRGTGTLDWSTVANLKESLIDRQFENFKEAIGNLDTEYVSSAHNAEKPTTEFERVMVDFAKECKLAGLGEISHTVTKEGIGQVKLKNGDVEIVIGTDRTFSVTRHGLPVPGDQGVDAFRELGEKATENMRQRMSKVSPPQAGTIIEIPDKNWQPVKHMILAEAGSSVIVKELNMPEAAASAGERKPAFHIRENQIKDTSSYKTITDPSDPGKKLFVNTASNRAYELGNRNPLTWEYEAFERPDITVRSAQFAHQVHLKSRLEKIQETIEGGRLLKQLGQAAQTTSPLVQDDRARRYFERVAGDAGEDLESIASRARDFYIHDADAALEKAVRRTKIVEDAGLKAGESKLLFTEAGKEFVPKTFHADKEAFETADGRLVELKNCRMEIRVGKGSDAYQSAREALAGFEQLRQELSLTKEADAESIRNAVRDSARTQYDQAAKLKTQAAEAFNREVAVKVGAFEVAGKNVDVFLTTTGVRIGNRDMSNRDLVEAALKEKRSQIAKAKDEVKQKLESELKELESLHKDITAGKAVEVERMKVALVENIAKEYEARRAPTPGSSIKGRAADVAGRAGAYLMIAAFVASLIAEHDKAKDTTESGYAPTKAR